MRTKVILLLLAATISSFAQTTTPAVPDDPSQIYATGISSNPSADPAIGGFGMYAKQLTGGTYGVTLIDIAPLGVHPFTVATQVSAGMAQKLFMVNKLPVYGLVAVGGAFQGTNSGFAWTGGGATIATIKNKKILLGLRFIKSAVSNGAGYQINPAVGYVF